MRFSLLSLGVLMLAVSQLAEANSRYDYRGDFQPPKASTPECAGLFTDREYVARFQLLANGTNAVVSLRGRTKDDFFHGVTLVGPFGFSDDFRVDKKFGRGERNYALSADGIVSTRLISFALKVKVTDAKTGAAVCTASSDYSGDRF